MRPNDRTRVLVCMDGALANLVRLTLRHVDCATQLLARSMDGVVPGGPPAQLAIVDYDRRPHVIRTLAQVMPVIAMTRRRDTSSKLAAYDAGAHDIIEAPFTPDEIIGRTMIALRRGGVSATLVPVVRLADIEVDVLAQQIRVDGRIHPLAPLRHVLLYLLAGNAGDTVTRAEIAESLWQWDDGVTSAAIDEQVGGLRDDLGGGSRTLIDGGPTEGYRFHTMP